MEFGLSDEQRLLQESVRRFAQEEIAPVAAEYDASGEFPREIIAKAWELGLVSTQVSPEYGGVGLSSLDGCIVTEELAWGCAGICTSIMANDLGLLPIAIAGTEAQKQAWLTLLTERFSLIAFCLSEPQAGSDVAGLQLKVSKEGEDYVLDGTKCWITNGGEADFYTVCAPR